MSNDLESKNHKRGLPVDLLVAPRVSIAQAICSTLQITPVSRIEKTIMRPSKKGSSDLAFCIPKKPGWTKQETVSKIMDAFHEMLVDDETDIAKYVETISQATDTHMAVTLKVSYTAQILKAITQQGYLSKLSLPQHHQRRVMIEYSQPNTHKAFHVGHMRNVALGDCLVRLKEHCGHSVVAANYFGDEGAHVAKCLWLLKQKLAESDYDDVHQLNVPPEARGEYLGQLYQDAVTLVDDLKSLTSYPCLGAIAASVLTKGPHPKKPDSWKVCTLDIGSEEPVTVVCAGTNYEVGELVAYMPVGTTFKKQPVAPTDILGVVSTGAMLSYGEVGATQPNPTTKTKPPKGKKTGKQASQSICIIPVEGAKPGALLTQLGRLSHLNKAADQTVAEVYAQRQKEVGNVLLALESGDPEWCKMWETTKQWSIDEFKNIYDWLGARFDVDFYESEVSKPSMELVQKYLQQGKVFVDLPGGAIGVNLEEYKLPFLLVVKSNGSGLYATKDLALAKRKCDQYQIDESIVVVDKGQTGHFKQVFATLDKMELSSDDNKSIHLAYGQVVRPEGKMSSRKGTVIYFSALQQSLTEAIDQEFLNKLKEEGSWSDEELLEANRVIAVGTIRYGMLNVDPAKDITFELKSWIAKKGNTGPYLMYAYARIQSILRKAGDNDNTTSSTVNVSLLDSTKDRLLLVHMTQFWPVVLKAASECKPNGLCKYLYVLAQDFMSWYEASPILRSDVPGDTKEARLLLVEAVASVLKTGMRLLGMTALERM